MKKATLLPLLLKQLRLPTVKKVWEEESTKAIEEGWHPAYYLQVLCEYEPGLFGKNVLTKPLVK